MTNDNSELPAVYEIQKCGSLRLSAWWSSYRGLRGLSGLEMAYPVCWHSLGEKKNEKRRKQKYQNYTKRRRGIIMARTGSVLYDDEDLVVRCFVIWGNGVLGLSIRKNRE